MERNQSWEEGDQKILDIISHHGSLEFLEIWDEIGEDDFLKEQIMTREELSGRLERLVAQVHVERIMDSEGRTLWALNK